MVRVDFEDLSNNNDFADVTLAYEDGQQGEAHKVILAGRSSFISSRSHHHISSWQEAAGQSMLSYHMFHLWSCKAQQEGAEQRENECGRQREGRLQLPPQLSSLPSAFL